MPLSANLAVVLAFGAISLAGPRVSAAPQVQLKPSTTKPGVYEKVEFGIEVDAEYRNPFDPEEVDLALRFVTPRGASLTVPAFRYQAYERRQLARGGKTSDWIYPVGVPEWKGRFAPMEPGRYRVVAVLRDRRGAVQSEPVVFEAVASPRKGFLRVGKKDPRYFQRDDGTPVFLIGQNLAFVGDSQYFNLAARKPRSRNLPPAEPIRFASGCAARIGPRPSRLARASGGGAGSRSRRSSPCPARSRTPRHASA